MGKVIRYDVPKTTSKKAIVVQHGRVYKGEEAERLHELFARPAKKPTPRMTQAIENYKRLMATKRSDAYDGKP